jgi:hypothetical protein
MALFSGRTSMLEVQNRALLKSAGERTQLISELERKLEQAGQALERLHAEREFYYKRVLALEQDNRDSPRWPRNTPYGARSWSENSPKSIPVVCPRDGSQQGTMRNPPHHAVDQGATYGRHTAQTQGSRRRPRLGGLWE